MTKRKSFSEPTLPNLEANFTLHSSKSTDQSTELECEEQRFDLVTISEDIANLYRNQQNSKHYYDYASTFSKKIADAIIKSDEEILKHVFYNIPSEIVFFVFKHLKEQNFNEDILQTKKTNVLQIL